MKKEKIMVGGPKSFYLKGKLAEDVDRAYRIWLKKKLSNENTAFVVVRKHKYSFSTFINELLEMGLKEFFKQFK